MDIASISFIKHSKQLAALAIKSKVSTRKLITDIYLDKLDSVLDTDDLKVDKMEGKLFMVTRNEVVSIESMAYQH